MVMSAKKQKAGYVATGELEDPNVEEPKIKYTKLHMLNIECVYGFLYGAMIAEVDGMVLLDYNEIYGEAAIGNNSVIWIQTDFLMGLDDFDNGKILNEWESEYK